MVIKFVGKSFYENQVFSDSLNAHIVPIYVGTSKVPPQLPATGPAPCGSNDTLLSSVTI